MTADPRAPEPGRRQQRCRVLLLAIALGVLFPSFERTWIALGAALVGIAILGFLYWRECWREP